MLSPLELANARYRRQKRISKSLIAEARRLWRQVDRRDFSRSWIALLPRLLVVFQAAQLASAQEAEAYVADLLTAQGIPQEPAGRVNPSPLVGVASDGRPLESLLYQPASTATSVLVAGGSPSQAAASGWSVLEMIAATQAVDAGRVAVGVGLAGQKHVGGYVRQVVGRTCGRCVVLAGKWYRWNTGFDRHYRCDCIHIPARENVAGDLTTDPKAFFNSLSEKEQNREFTKAGARAIRDGADISRVVNARKGAFGLSPASGRLTAAERKELIGGGLRGRLRTQRVFGRDLFLTSEATTKRALNRKIRLMPESVYSLTKTREEAVALLKVHGYIL